MSTEAQLTTHLLQNYERINSLGVARPVSNPNDTINVQFGIALIDFISIDKQTGQVELKLWERYVSITSLRSTWQFINIQLKFCNYIFIYVDAHVYM